MTSVERVAREAPENPTRKGSEREMEHPDSYKFDDLSDTDKKDAYKAVLSELRRTNRILDTLMVVAKAYPIHD